MNQNKEEQIRYADDELITKGNLEVIKTAFAADYVAHAGEKQYSGHAFLKRFANQVRTAIPNIILKRWIGAGFIAARHRMSR